MEKTLNYGASRKTLRKTVRKPKVEICLHLKINQVLMIDGMP